MHTITAAMAWEYFARNRWTLLLFPFIANLMPIFVLGALSGYNVTFGSREFIGIYLGFILYATAVIGIGVLMTQGSISRYYLKPLSTTTMVNFFFWGGALLAGGQLASSIAIWNALFDANWPIAGPTLFAIVLWGAFQPLLRVPVKSLVGILLAFGLVALVWYWFLTRHGDPQDFKMHFWNTLSGFDLLLATAAVTTGYGLTLWRVQRDRSGRQLSTLTDRIQKQFERWLSQYATLTRPFASPMRAHRWFDLQTRTFMMPLICLLFLLAIWFCAFASAAYYQEAEVGLQMVFAGTQITATVQLVIAFVIGIVMIQGYQWNSGRKMRGQDQVAMRPSEHRIGHYLHSLPISNSQMSKAILQSSALSIATSTLLLVLSFALSFTWSWVVDFNLKTVLDPKIAYWQLAMLGIAFYVLLPFALMNNLATFTLVVDRQLWLPPIIIGTIILFALWPLYFGIVLAAAVFGLLVYCTVRSLKQKFVTVTSALIAWLLAGVTGIALVFSLRPEDISIAIVIAVFLGSGTILPIFSLPLALQHHRTT